MYKRSLAQVGLALLVIVLTGCAGTPGAATPTTLGVSAVTLPVFDPARRTLESVDIASDAVTTDGAFSDARASAENRSLVCR
jgi:hypothetical protein